MSIFFHIDVNSAFLSWTSVHNLETGTGPDLRSIPAIIGGDRDKRHGIVLAKSIPCKKYGIVTAEPIVNAIRKCPGLVMAPPDFHVYSTYSHRLMEHLACFCPDIEQVSIDECYMDFTPIQKNFKSPEEAAYIIKNSVKETFGFTVNIGISDRKVLAKMASDFQKPDKVHTLFHDEIEAKMWPLPVGDLFLCGKSSASALRNLGFNTIGDLAKADKKVIEDNLKSIGTTLWNYANGIDSAGLNLYREREKSIGNSTTPPKDLTTKEDAERTLLSLSESVASRLRKAGLYCNNICVEIKYSTFESVSHQMNIDRPTSSSQDIYQCAVRLFDDLWNGDPVRLLGVRSGKLVDTSAPVQLSLFDYLEEEKATDDSPVIPPEKIQRLENALDSIRAKYGKDAIKRASLK